MWKAKLFYAIIIIGLSVFVILHLSSFVPPDRIKYVSSIVMFGRQNVNIINKNENIYAGGEGKDSSNVSINESDGQFTPGPEEVQGTTPAKRLVTNPPKKTVPLKQCVSGGSKLVGNLYISQNIPSQKSLDALSIDYGGVVEKGGWWSPRTCKPLKKLALILPYRKREKQLKVFLHHLHPILQRQLLYYRIIVVEQLGETPFNRAGLFNIGFVEALKIAPFDCFVFSDVDLLPENDKNFYGCPTSPRHMSVAVDKFNYRLPYKGIFGGAGAFTRKDFEKINGMSNLFWGWGGEDDDLYKRITQKGFKLTRPSMAQGRYTMIKQHHFRSTKADPNRMNLLRSSTRRMNSDGLSGLKYHLKEVVEEPLVTFVKVDMRKEDYAAALRNA